MAIGSNPSRSEIMAEFADGYKPANGSLKEAYARVFGGDGSGYSRDAFAGTGKPEFTVTTLKSHYNGSRRFTVYVENYVAGTSYYRIQYHKNTGSIPFSGSYSTTSWETATGLSSFAVITIDNLDYDSTYYMRVQYYNGFASSANPFTDPHFSETTGSPPVYTTPSIDEAFFSGANIYVYFSHITSTVPSSYDLQYRLNGGSWSNGILQSSDNFGDADSRKYGMWGMTVFPSPLDTVEIRIRSASGGGISASSWTSAYTADD